MTKISGSLFPTTPSDETKDELRPDLGLTCTETCHTETQGTGKTQMPPLHPADCIQFEPGADDAAQKMTLAQ